MIHFIWNNCSFKKMSNKPLQNIFQSSGTLPGTEFASGVKFGTNIRNRLKDSHDFLEKYPKSRTSAVRVQIGAKSGRRWGPLKFNSHEWTQKHARLCYDY